MSELYIVMGVSGCGKSTVGQALADRLGCDFYDGDDFHPAENVAKMASGTPLTDVDRAPWLARLHELMQTHAKAGTSAVIACSALKKSYRDQLRGDLPNVTFVHLAGDFELIWGRMQARANHYMKADMLQSQFDALEPPTAEEALILPITASVDELIDQIVDSAEGAA